MQAVLRYLLLFLAVVSVAVPAHSGKKDVDFSSDSRKAEVLYMEALVKRVEGDNASFYDLIERIICMRLSAIRQERKTRQFPYGRNC